MSQERYPIGTSPLTDDDLIKYLESKGYEVKTPKVKSWYLTWHEEGPGCTYDSLESALEWTKTAGSIVLKLTYSPVTGPSVEEVV